MTRRRVAIAALLGAVAVVVVARVGAARVRTGSAAAHGATVVRYRIRSPFVHRTLAQTAAIPPGAGAGRPLLVFLHGRGAGNESNANGAFFAALAALGDRAPDVVFPSGDHSYFHRRRGGDRGRYVLDEVARGRGRRAWGHARLWLDGGTADPFRAADEALAAALRIRMRHWPGGHDDGYWHVHYGRYLRFYADALAAC